MTRSAICRSRVVKSTVSRKPAASRMASAQTSEMVLPPTSTASDSGLSRAPLHTGHGHLAHVALVALPAPVGVGLGVPPLDERHDALEAGRVGAVAAVAVLVADVDLVVLAVQQRLLGARRQRPPRHVHRELHVLGQRRHDPLEVLGRADPCAHGWMAPSASD